MVFLLLQKGSNLSDYSLDRQFRDQRQEVSSSLRDGFESLSQQLERMTGYQQDQLSKQTKTFTENFNSLINANDKQLNSIKQTVDEKLETTLQKQFKTNFKQVAELLNSVQDKLTEIDHFAKEVDSLQKTLSNVSSRGAWGEAQLSNLLSEILNPNQYETNFCQQRGKSATGWICH